MTSTQVQLTPTSSSSNLYSSYSHDNINLSSDPIWFARLQEVLLMHRPFDFCVLLVVVELIFGFIYFLNLGIFATIALLGLIAYMLFIHYCHSNPIFEKIFFPPLKKPIDQTQPNRIRSYEEFSNFIASVHHGFQHYFGHKHLTGIKRIIFGVGSFIFALLLKRVVPFWVNFLLVHCILFLPLAILRPWPAKDIPNDETRLEESTTQAASQTTNTVVAQGVSPETSTPSDNSAADNANSNNNQNSATTPNKTDNNNNSPVQSSFREVIMEPTDEDPLSNTGKILTPSSKSSTSSNNNNNNNNDDDLSYVFTPPTVNTPTMNTSTMNTSTMNKSTGLPPTPPLSPSSNNSQNHPSNLGLPPIPPSTQPSTPKPTNAASNPSVTTKAATAPKKRSLLKSRLKRKNSQDETD